MKNMDTDKNIWDKQNGESEKAYQAFCVFLDMGSDRTVDGVAKKLSKSRQLMTRWCATYKWRDRAAAYDNSIMEETREEVVKNAANKGKNRLWDRWEGESDEAYEAFQAYLNMGTGRTLERVNQEYTKSIPLLKRWSSAYKWQERIAAYDSSIVEEARDQAIKETKRMVKRHINIAMKMQTKALEAMSNLTPQDMKVTDIRDFIKLATDLERQNRLIIDDEENDEGLKENMTVRIYLPEKDEDCEE